MKFRGLLSAVVILAALGGVLYWSQRHPPSADNSQSEKLPTIAAVPERNVVSFTLAAKGAAPITVEAHGADQWEITSPIQTPADHDAVAGILNSITRLTADRIVADHAANPAQYGLADPAVTLDVAEKGNQSAHLVFGDHTPTGGDTYAMARGDAHVYTVADYTLQSVSKSLDQLRDKRLLPLKATDVSEVELERPGQTIALDRKAGGWQMEKPVPYRTDDSAADSLVRQLVGARFDSSATSAEAEAGWNKGSPLVKVSLSASVGGSSAIDTLDVRKGSSGDYYARASAMPGVWKLDTSVDSALTKNLDDLRNKQVLNLGFNEPLNIDYHSASTTLNLVRSNQDWFQNGRKMDADSVESLVIALRNLAATGFTTTGFAKPDIDLTVTSQAGKVVDKVHFQQTKDGAIAKRDDGPSLYTLDSATMNALYSAASAVKPAATTPPAAKK